MDQPAIEVNDLDFAYGEGPPVLSRLAFRLPRGVRCLLVGANGAGKTTLLSLLAGRRMIPDESVRVLGRPAFSDTSLSRRVGFIGGAFPLDVDVRVEEILGRVTHLDGVRCERLLSVLAVEPRWRMCRVSDGQRRRVQILLGLLAPSELLLLDEVTTDLDVIARADLLAFLRADSEERGTTILYASHILDGLDAWATHLAHLDEGRIARYGALADFHELRDARLLRVVEKWLRR